MTSKILLPLKRLTTMDWCLTFSNVDKKKKITQEIHTREIFTGKVCAIICTVIFIVYIF